VLVGGGTVGYLAPERLQPTGHEQASASPASDIYSLGMIFYEMLTGRLPGRRSPLPSQARKDVPVAFDDVFDRMTRDELKERYSSIDGVLEGIYKAFETKDVFTPNTIVLWAEDPRPPPKDAEPQQPGPLSTESGTPSSDASEVKTGEYDLVEAGE